MTVFERKCYTELKDKHKGESCFILGAGVSLKECIENENFDGINDHVVISVNSSILALDWAEGSDYKRYWESNDSATRLWSYWHTVMSSQCNRVIRDSWEKHFVRMQGEFYVFSPRDNEKYSLEDDKLAAASSMPTAIDLAMQMGCDKIFLLGVDHYMVGGFSHFWELMGSNYRPTNRQGIAKAPMSSQKEVFNKNQKDYLKLKRMADNNDIKVYNCSEKSKVTVFEKIDFNKALDMA